MILLGDTSSAYVLAAGIKATVGDGELTDIMHPAPELMIWILLMGNIAAFKTEFKTWFADIFARVLSLQKIDHVESVRMTVIEFLWLEGIMNAKLDTVWTDVQPKIKV